MIDRPDASGRRWGSLEDAENLRDLVHHLREAIYIARPDGLILDANQAFLDLTGLETREDLVGRRLDDFFADPDARRRLMDHLEEHGEVRDAELWLISPDGTLKAVMDTGFLRRDPATGEAFVHGLLVDITSRKELEATLRDQSVRDALTGLHNRRWLDERVAQLATQPDAAWGCIYIDIDRFKQYNDTHGHQAGDEVLVKMARFLQREVRAEEGVVRVGGDEYVIVMTGSDAAATEQVARRLQLDAYRTAPAGFSLGWAVREGRESLWRTLDRADQALLKVRVVSRTPGARASDR